MLISTMIPVTPSFCAHVLNGLLILLAVFLLIKHYRTLRPYETVVVALLFSIGIGLHGISHLGLETAYKYNPLNATIQ
jgi:hypothetical protein